MLSRLPAVLTSSMAPGPPDLPAAAPTPLRDLAALRLMLEQGWQIEAPVLARLAWSQRRTGELDYHVILARAAQRTLVVIATSPAIRQFLSENNIPVV